MYIYNESKRREQDMIRKGTQVADAKCAYKTGVVVSDGITYRKAGGSRPRQYKQVRVAWDRKPGLDYPHGNEWDVLLRNVVVI